MVEEPEYASGNVLGRDSILNYDIGAPIPVEAFGGTVYVLPLSGEDRDRFEQSNLEQRKNGTTRLNLTNARARLFQLCVVDKNTGRRLFSRADVEKIGKLPAAELDKVTEVAKEASGLGDEEDDLVESFDEATPAAVGAGSSSV